MSKHALDVPFPPASREDWLRRVTVVLNGADFEARQTADGIKIEPLYGRQSGPRADRAVHGPWTVQARVDNPDPLKANRQALDDLNGSAAGLTLVGMDHFSARGFGLAASDIAPAFKDVQLHAISLRIEGGNDAALGVARMVEKQPIDPARLDVSFGQDDPALIANLVMQGFNGPFLEADGRPWHERGVSEGEELGAVLAAAAKFLREAEPQHIGLTLAANQDMFLTLAKFRAMRLLWQRLLEASRIPFRPVRLHGETSWLMMAVLDPHTNILRACAAAFGAGLGGADSFCVLPFSVKQGLPNAFARRVARNVQMVLLEESNLWRVSDPASGAGYVESLTEALCEKAWAVFQKTDAGQWPEPNPRNRRSQPMIGSTVYQLPKEFAAQVEALS